MNTIPVSAASASSAWIDADKYHEMYAQSIRNPVAFWGKHAEHLDWIKPFSKVTSGDFTGDVQIKWFEDGTLNASLNCIDRHLPERATKTAIIWEPDNPSEPALHITYAELHEKVCAFANVLKRHGVVKGDRVIIYLPMIPEAAYALLACARIGAVHSVVFAGFSPHSLRERILDCGAKLVITADEGLRAGRKSPLKANMDEALASCPDVKKSIVVRRTGNVAAWHQGRDVWLHDEMESVSTQCAAEEMNAEDPFFILYTSGSTGTPKGVLHTTAGYLLYAALTHKWVLDYHDGDDLLVQRGYRLGDGA